ncbi:MULTISPECIES: helix-turn-helix domain-containing protein [Rhizobium]|uniref:helix-turn-helix domain-containing protein n=1 Tax=Rhizobium TaxID=379 RepID=UPI001C90BADC|nr:MULTISPECIES: helix-turn-helix transcriptional regulator [Rhizobium]MBY3168102.1 helix-turn-helix transcriptional regulator [Rhizobium laguerreae]MBY3295732.1 helix-turn-helix transcriptional regulator [Rhizobium laguerreae]MBY3310853.1 helix-turn-helix transcriptional regulator [Rhizobium laguerreae]MBY3323975.1 helix-turn-helix transcriptional regulator [Rhizobium laguerreae]MBY3540170.1 helix-turn-helix transcriptional regulator [Rhizobium laguerreae]
MAILLTADLIRAARGLLGWSQGELASLSGVSQKALSDFELGKRPLTAKASDKLRAAFEVRYVQFIAEKDVGGELVGAGVRWRSDNASLHIKVV